ncbi:hypothetical protein LDENG_00252720 [Lucifuga dentata]|nr:hypothetical protein LDENG_00252720 [Lucifuga dentata]
MLSLCHENVFTSFITSLNYDLLFRTVFLRPSYMRSYHPGWTIVILCSPVSTNLFWENCSLYRMLLQDCCAELAAERPSLLFLPPYTGYL